MLDLSVIHRPGMIGDFQNLGRVLESMLYYDRVHLIMSAQMFTGFWDALGPDDFAALLSHPTITTTLTPEMLAIKTDTNASIVTHRPVAFRLAGRDKKLIHDKDDVGALVLLLEGSPTRPGNRSEVAKLVKLTQISRYEKILGKEAVVFERLSALVNDQETLKLFLRGWATSKGYSTNEVALSKAEISTLEVDGQFMIASTVPLEQMVPSWNPDENWGHILNSLQDYATDLHLSNAYSADIVTSPEISEVASARVDLSLQRALRSSGQITAFEEMAFGEAHGFADAFNDGLITFAEALKVIDKSRRFRTWTNGLAPDANLITEYHRAVTKDTILGSLPSSLARFAIFNGGGLLADVAAPGSGLIPSAIDSFIVERLLGGWRPNIFVRNVQKVLSKAHRRAVAGADD